MTYKFLNALFGWDYIYWENMASSGIARVQVSASGDIYYWRYKRTKVLDIITKSNQVFWLTCKSSRYLTEVGG